MRRNIGSLLFLAILLLIAGCVISPRVGGGGSTGGNTTGVGHLYVSDQGASQILTFAQATADNGNIAATAVIASTNLSDPQYIFSDGVNDRLYVANLGGSNILVFNSVSTLSGNVTVTPTRIISSPNMSSPTDLTLDSSRDLLYVADTDRILIFAGASGANGSVSAQQIITLAFTPSALLLDASANVLFAANSSGNQVVVLQNASTLNGPLGTTPILGGPNNGAQLSGPSGLQLDPAGRLIVSNAGNSTITIYANATQLNGDIAPTTIISGSGAPQAPAQIAIDSTTNSGELYVTAPSASEVAVFTSIITATGNLNGAQPSRTFTGVQSPRGVAIDTSH